MTRDQRRYDQLQKLGCVACLISSGGWEAADVHHIVDKGYRKHSGGNQATIPLCPWHHRGVPTEGRSMTWMRNWRGPSLALESKAFAETYGTQRDLLAKVNNMLTYRETAL